MRRTKTLALSIIVSVSLIGCTEKRLEMEQLASMFSEIPVVPIMFPANGPKVTLGSATVVGNRELLLSPHQLGEPAGKNPDLPDGPILVDNCLWLYSVAQRVDGPTDASGWAIIRLSKLDDYSREELRQIPIIAERTDEELNGLLDAEWRLQCELPEIPEFVEFDFEREIPRHKSVAIAYTQTVLDGRKLKYYDPDLRYKRKFCLGSIYSPSVYPEERLEEFLLLETKQSVPMGASGSPAYILKDDNKTAVIVGINGGRIKYDPPQERTFRLIRRPHELALPLKEDGVKKAKAHFSIYDLFKAGDKVETTLKRE